ncbi:hypothetical protein BC828DRAFT_389821 [Blastocladiella britannica]|nr:hypothetical protein BC828DRAFT_389821 [Blastocladiella britannica]
MAFLALVRTAAPRVPAAMKLVATTTVVPRAYSSAPNASSVAGTGQGLFSTPSASSSDTPAPAAPAASPSASAETTAAPAAPVTSSYVPRGSYGSSIGQHFDTNATATFAMGRAGGNAYGGAGSHQMPVPEPYIVHVGASFNNTTITVTTPSGNAVAVCSGGTAGFKKANRAGYEPAYQATKQALDKFEAKVGDTARSFALHLKFKGFGPGRDAAWKCVQANGWPVVMVQDVTPIAHGGCRPRKARRL